MKNNNKFLKSQTANSCVCAISLKNNQPFGKIIGSLQTGYHIAKCLDLKKTNIPYNVYTYIHVYKHIFMHHNQI